jgi:hypothetical protein
VGLQVRWKLRVAGQSAGGPGLGLLAWRDGRQRDAGHHPVDHVLGRDAVGERVVGQHQPVPEDVRRDVLQVLRQRVVAPAHKGQRPGRGDQTERRAGGRPVGDQPGHVGKAVLGRRPGGEHQPHGVVDERVVHEHIVRRLLQSQ